MMYYKDCSWCGDDPREYCFCSSICEDAAQSCIENGSYPLDDDSLFDIEGEE